MKMQCFLCVIIHKNKNAMDMKIELLKKIIL